MNGDGRLIDLGWLWGEGRSPGGLPNAKFWVVVETSNFENTILYPGKLRTFYDHTFLFSGTLCDAANYILSNGGADKKVMGLEMTRGDFETAMTYHHGKATVGKGGTATVGDYGIATAGAYGKAISGNYGCSIVGPYGTAITNITGKVMAGFGGIIEFKELKITIDDINYFSNIYYELNNIANDIIPSIDGIKKLGLAKFFSLEFLEKIRFEEIHIQFVKDNIHSLDKDSRELFLNFLAAEKLNE